MPQRLAGQLVDGGDPVADEPVFVVDTGPADESNWSIVATDRSAGDGSWSATVPNADPKRYHAVAQFEDGGTLKNALSKPFLTSQPFAQPGLVTVGFDVLPPSTIGSAIPDSEVWESEDTSAEFWEDTGEVFFLEEESDTDVLISSEFGDGDGVINTYERRDEWDLETDPVDVDESHSRGNREWDWVVEGDRYVHRQIQPSGTESDRNPLITVLGPYSMSGVETFHYRLEQTANSATTFGMAVVLADPGTSNGDDVEVIDRIEDTGTVDSSADISGLSGEKELAVLMSAGSSDIELIAQSMDLFFE